MLSCRALAVGLFLVSLISVQADSRWGNYTVSKLDETDSGIQATLVFNEGEVAFPYGTMISPLSVDVEFSSDSTMRVKILDPNNSRWQVPGVVMPSYKGDVTADRLYSVTVSSVGEVFNLEVTRGSSSESVFDSADLFFADRYIEWGTAYPEDTNIYGLGERVGPLRYDTDKAETYSFMASDHFTPPKLPLYGSHPYYIQVRPAVGDSSSNGTAGATSNGAFLLNSNPMDVVLAPEGLTYKTIGGIIDLFVFLGPSPHEVTQQYQKVIGKPYLPPHWSLGYHQCRWGYENYTDIQYVIDKFDEYELPADVFWVDIDYMQRWKMFTVDPSKFPAAEMKKLTDGLRASGRRFVPIIDPGVRIEAGYEAYEDGIAKEVFIRDPRGVNFTIGKVWPGLVHYPDWTHPNTPDYWNDHIAEFNDLIGIDGLWTDMNEVASFCDGRCILTEKDDHAGAADESLFVCNCTDRFDTGEWDDPPYQPVDTLRNDCRSITAPFTHGLDCATISMASNWHLDKEHNLHNLYGHLEAVQTADALQKINGQRSFVLTRSTFPSTGRHASHWLGDNSADWYDLWKSIPGVLNMNLFGIPHVGADICGFAGDTTVELCARWMQAGAFYPFMRNHNTLGGKSQEPYALGDEVLAISRTVLKLRYSLIPFWYTLFYRAHSEGGAVARPLFYEFPDDEGTYAVGEQSMIGSAFLVSPVVTEGARKVNVYFPKGNNWYDYESGKLTVKHDSSKRSKDLDTPLEKLQVHLRGGSMVPVQTPGRTTVAQAGNYFHLVTALNHAAEEGAVRAEGTLYLDDGLSLDNQETGKFTDISFTATTNCTNSVGEGIDIEVEYTAQGAQTMDLSELVVLGWDCPSQCAEGTQVINNGTSTFEESLIPNNRILSWLPSGGHHFDLTFAQRFDARNSTSSLFHLRCTCQSSSSSNEWVVPVVASIGGVLLLAGGFKWYMSRKNGDEAQMPLMNQ